MLTVFTDIFILIFLHDCPRDGRIIEFQEVEMQDRIFWGQFWSWSKYVFYKFLAFWRSVQITKTFWSSAAIFNLLV